MEASHTSALAPALAEGIASSKAFEGALAGKRVLIVVENLPVPFDRRVWQEARSLKAAGAEVSVICPTGKGYETLEETLDGIHIFRHPLPTEASNAAGYIKEYAAALWHETRLAWKVFFRHGFDVIHGCNPPDLIFLVALQFRLFGKPFIFDHHDLNPELYEAKFSRGGFFLKLVRIAERLTFMAARCSIATNESYRSIAIERGGMDPEKVFVVRSGPDLGRLRAVPPNPALRKGRQFMVGYVGVMGAQEGIDLLLEAAAHLVFTHKREDIQFCIVGAGTSLEDLKAQSARMGLAPYVDFLGRVPDRELVEALCTADVCVNPDRVNPMNDKSTMNKILEYMALGKPIVQFDVIEGRVSAGEASLYARKNDPIDLAENIATLLADPEMRERMGQFGRQRVVERFAWPHQVPQLIATYQTALGLENRR